MGNRQSIAAVVTAAAVALLLISGVLNSAYAFHDGSVAQCDGCHSMHNAQDGLGSSSGAAGSLLRSTDASSVCLSCHSEVAADHNVLSTVSGAGALPGQMTPGGDFAWLKISTTYLNSGGTVETNPGTRHGHNVVAMDYNLLPSTVFTTAPGGSYPSTELSCISCHDPHGRYRVNSLYQMVSSDSGQAGAISGSGSYGVLRPAPGSAVGVYRLLGGVNYLLQSLSSGLAFVNPSPFAFVPQNYNRSEAVTDTRVAYASGMSEWCANCHALYQIHTAPTSTAHPAGDNFTAALSNPNHSSAIGDSVAARYNAYISSGNLTGTPSSSYTSMVPYEEGLLMNSATYLDLATRAVNDGSQTGGPGYYPSGGSEVVMCLSCHRAHASAWPGILRWNAVYGQYLTIQGVYPGIDAAIVEAQAGEYNLGYVQAQVQRSFNDRPASVYSAYQKSLCKKCHNDPSDS